jgi:hypothetical protein
MVDGVTEPETSPEETPGRGRFSVLIGGRRVIVTIGTRSQTIAICTVENQAGKYDAIFRLTGRAPLLPEDVTVHDDADKLRMWISSLGSSAQYVGMKSGRRLLPELIASPAADDAWLADSVAVVEAELDLLTQDFLANPFLHRVEHSVHAELFSRLVRHDRFAERHQIGSTGQVTQLVHKEWPETYVDESVSATRKGNFDLAILAPNQLAAATLEHLRTGTVAAGIVVEMGLNYALKHLQQDEDKLRQSRVSAGYLVHLSRDGRRDTRAEEFMLGADRQPNIKIAYAHSGDDGSRALKLVNEQLIR